MPEWIPGGIASGYQNLEDFSTIRVTSLSPTTTSQLEPSEYLLITEIKGVPPDILPLLIQASNAQKKLLAKILKYKKQQQSVPSVQNANTAISSTTIATATVTSSTIHNVKYSILNCMERQEKKEKQEKILNEIPAYIKDTEKNVIESVDALIT